jgi:hypothetical protein
VDSNYLLGDHYREVIRKRDENEVYFQPTKHRFEMASGVEAIVSDRDFAMLRIHSPTVVRSSTGWVVTRTCFSDSRPKDVIELVEERVSFRGDYHRKVLWQYDPPQDIHLWIMYEQ